MKVTKCNQMTTDFGDWLLQELEKRDWSQAKLARMTGVTRQAINAYINKRRTTPDAATIDGIAKAFGMSTQEVFRAAGLMPELPTPRDKYVDNLTYRLELLTDDQLEDVLKYIEFISTREQKPIKIQT